MTRLAPRIRAWHDACMSFKDWIKKNWVKLAGASVAVVGAFVPGLQPLVPLGGVIFGTGFQVGASIGTPIGQSAKRVAETHDVLSELNAKQLEQLVKLAKEFKP